MEEEAGLVWGGEEVGSGKEHSVTKVIKGAGSPYTAEYIRDKFGQWQILPIPHPPELHPCLYTWPGE